MLVVTAAVAIVCPAVLGAAAATVTQSIATSAIIGAATSGVMNGIASMNSGNSFYDGFASGFESGAILGAISGGLGAGTSAIMSGAELTVGRVMAVKAMNMVSDATVDSVVYAYHLNKYDKDFTGGDIVKTWVKSAATSFAMQSVGGGKSSSKTETSYGKSSGKYDTTADFLTNIENRNGKFYTDKATIDKIGQVEARGEDFSLLNKRIMSSRASTEGGTSVVYKYSDELGTKYLIHEVTDARGYIIHRDFDAVRISSGQLINKGH